MTKVSIIVPTYNRKSLISCAIDSVLRQTFEDFELLIVDDGSTDNTGDFIKENYTDKRIRYFYQENQGQTYARNKALGHSVGEYICFLDSDDYWPTNKLEISLKVFEDNPDIDVVYGDEMVINHEGEELGREKIKRYSGNITKHLLVENFIGMSASMVKADKIKEVGGMDEKVRVADDFSLWLRLSRTSQFYYLDEVLGYYRLTEGQISVDKIARLDSNLRTVLNFLNNYPDCINKKDKSEALCEFYSKRVRILGELNRYGQGLREFFLAFRSAPDSLLPWRALYRLFIKAKVNE